jgi:hypothetical protein
MNTFSKILELLPTLILAVEKVAADLSGHQKKQMVSDVLQSTAQAVAQSSPENGKLAQAAADLAVSTLDSVVAIVKPPVSAASTPQSAAAAGQ